MAVNRIHRFQLEQPSHPVQNEPVAMVAVPIQQPVPCVPFGFVVCQIGFMPMSAWQQAVYRLAYEQAKAATEIPRHYRRMFSVWN